MSIGEKLKNMGIPGFRSGKKWKMLIASIGYFWILSFILVMILVPVPETITQDTGEATVTPTPAATATSEPTAVPEPAPTKEVVEETIKSGLTQDHLNQVSGILSDAGYANMVEVEGAVMFVSLYDETLTWDDIEILTRSLTEYVYNNAGTGTATVNVYVDNILMAEGNYKIWSGSIEVELKR